MLPRLPNHETGGAGLKARGYRFARTGGSRAYAPGEDDPLLMPQAFDGKPKSTLEQFKEAVNKAKDGKVSVMAFHGVPGVKHPWVNTDPEKFKAYLDYLKESGCKVVALRDLEKVNPMAEDGQVFYFVFLGKVTGPAVSRILGIP